MYRAFRNRRETSAVPGLNVALLAITLSACARLHGPAPPVRLLVFNIHAGKDASEKPSLDGVASLINSTRADIVLLQEVDRGTARSGHVDQVQTLADRTHYSTAFGPSLLHYDGGEYGIAALSSGSIGFQLTVPLPVYPVQTRAGGSHEPRVALVALATIRGHLWRAINTHLDPAEGPARAQEVSELADLVRQQLAAGTALVIGGDFNSTPDNPVLRPLADADMRDAWKECGKGEGHTYPAANPSKRIDYLFLTGDVHCSAAEVLDTQVSDHRPLLVTLR
jgi:endonuclease/exonuclease/phosphatase family metal-dependent hydrolase